MKNVFKRALSLIMVLSLLIGTVAVSASAITATGKCNCGHCPVIILPGINHSPTYLYDANNEPVYNDAGEHIGGSLLIIDEDKVKDDLPSTIFFAVISLLAQTDVKLTEKVSKLAKDAFNIQRCDYNGNMVNNLQVKRWYHSLAEVTHPDDLNAAGEKLGDSSELSWVYRMVPMKPLVDEIGEDHTYFFTFNLIANPMDSAADLEEYIDMVCEQTGHDKVDLIPVSLGGTILTAYLDSFGHDKVNAIVGAVACMNGTDIVADMMERKFKLNDDFLYHEYIAKIFEESEGYGTYGYLINGLLRILPRDLVNKILTTAMDAILESLMINCPQFWAMVPADRYDALAKKYLETEDRWLLKSKTDRFQDARLNLKDNILAAVDDGVKVNFIAGANLHFGDVEYSYFSIMDSADKVNSDGIINLESTTLDAYGTISGELPANYTQKYTNPLYPDYSYISPDNRIDASTALLSDNTWIFLNQHHEVGKNDVVLNLAKDLILGNVTDVHSDPDKYPQFNYTCNTKEIRRWLLPDAKAVDQSTLSAEDAAELNAAIADGEAVLSATIADQDKVYAAQERLRAILTKLGVREEEKEEVVNPAIGEKITELISKGLLKIFGGEGFFDVIKKLIGKLIDKI